MSNSKKTKNSRFVLVLFFLVLLGPFIFAWILVQKSNHFNLRLNNHGDLITPVQPVNEDALKKQILGKWWLVYISPSQCQQTCHDILYNMRQIRIALGKEAPRLERMFIVHPHCPTSVCETYLSESYPDMIRVNLTQQNFDKVFGQLGSQSDRETYGEMFVIDPKGNIMMHYDPDTLPKDILSDLKRLLKVSKIG